MAGIVMSLGSVVEKVLDEVRQNYEQLKGLEISCQYNSSQCHLFKYKRLDSQEDKNFFDSDKITLCIVGTLLYKKYGISESVNKLGQDLNNGMDLVNLIGDIDGHYFLTLVSKTDSQTLLMTDAGGAISTYIVKDGKNYFVSTSMLALAQYFPVTVNLSAVMAFLRTGIFFDNSTYFNEIEVLQPGTIFTYAGDNASLETEEYWHVPDNIDENVTIDGAAKKLQEALSCIVDRLPAEETLYDFTGGYDSRFVLALAYSKQKKLNTFYFGPLGSREEKIVRDNCADLEIAYNNYPLPDDWSAMFFDYVLESVKLSDGMINAFDYAPVLWIQKKKKTNFNYAVLGLFGEIYRNFTAKQEFWSAGKNKQANLEKFISFRNLAGSFDLNIFSKKIRLEIDKVPQYLFEKYRKTNAKMAKDAPNTLQLDNIYFTHRMRKWGGRFLTTTNQILQPVCPLWFRKPLSITFSLPHSMKAGEKILKKIVKKTSPEFTVLKTIYGTPFDIPNRKNFILFLPGLVFWIMKAFRKFVEVVFKKSILESLTLPNYDSTLWFKGALKDPRCKDILDYHTMLSRKYYNEECFERFIAEAQKTDFDYYNQMGLIATVEMTFRAANLK